MSHKTVQRPIFISWIAAFVVFVFGVTLTLPQVAVADDADRGPQVKSYTHLANYRDGFTTKPLTSDNTELNKPGFSDVFQKVEMTGLTPGVEYKLTLEPSYASSTWEVYNVDFQKPSGAIGDAFIKTTENGKDVFRGAFTPKSTHYVAIVKLHVFAGDVMGYDADQISVRLKALAWEGGQIMPGNTLVLKKSVYNSAMPHVVSYDTRSNRGEMAFEASPDKWDMNATTNPKSINVANGSDTVKLTITATPHEGIWNLTGAMPFLNESSGDINITDVVTKANGKRVTCTHNFEGDRYVEAGNEVSYTFSCALPGPVDQGLFVEQYVEGYFFEDDDFTSVQYTTYRYFEVSDTNRFQITLFGYTFDPPFFLDETKTNTRTVNVKVSHPAAGTCSTDLFSLHLTALTDPDVYKFANANVNVCNKPSGGGETPSEGSDNPSEGGGNPSEGVDNPSEGGNTPSPIGTRNSVYRVGGQNRYLTSVYISKQFKPGVPVAYVATGNDYPDALAAASVAGAQKSPVLLTEKSRVSPDVIAELKRLQPKRIVVVGGEGVVSKAVFNQLKSTSGFTNNVVRKAGSNRYATAVAVAQDAYPGKNQVIFVASGEDFPDALAASSAAAYLGGPVLLTTKDKLSDETWQAISKFQPKRIVFVGGPGVISDKALSKAAQTGAAIDRLGGKNRFDTARSLAESVWTGKTPALAVVANGMNFPDALAGAAYAGAKGGPVMLTLPGTLPSETATALTKTKPKSVMVSGGKGVVSDPVKSQIAKVTKLQNR